ncbi:exopolyphosphatase/guanosine-5'-triphosphate,3'-diphosphate pyrophosphatase [Marinobacterium halophilum]|uniref:Exopolyphosphatase n=1 Tax=Marinobacterium halophilum TaxID=267374 RepID=A0A2P8EY34_9GAMM|nr:exopolyphosphatase [Marinobacterium halophilum]PSL14389.1 exopolyphosphatase/guanosine-5'-triphosphate,3'-diphosphate pyrophosphatase [Marinobacterium halophilum]
MHAQDPSPTPTADASLLAAIDLGSNSFHIIVSQLFAGELKTLDVLSEKVQLAAGMDAEDNLTDAAIERGLECLSRFAQRVSDLPRASIRVVGTNALRQAHNSTAFLSQAQALLGTPVEVIAGREEARLIYLGVAHTLADDTGRRLVVDIGGGSTECIIGERFEPRVCESLHMGCVSYSDLFFADGEITAAAMHAARTAALQELLSIRRNYRRLGWNSSVGASGTVKAARQACIALGFSTEHITREALQQLSHYLIEQGHCEQLQIDGIKPERCAVLPAGVAILSAIFESLDVRQMSFSEGALREGVLYDMAGRLRHEDVRERTINALTRRYHVDRKQASRVEATALIALAQLKESWGLTSSSYHEMLSWAARSHEIGLAVAHSQFHKHSAYLLHHSDLPGFTHLEQQLLAFLVRGHRRKFPKDEYRQLPEALRQSYRYLCLLLRLSVVMHRSRSKARLPAFTLRADAQKVELHFPPGWLDHHPLTRADLEQEAGYLRNIDFKLKVS